MNSFIGPRRAGGPEKVSLGRISIDAGHADSVVSLLMTLLGETLTTSKELRWGV